jgi:hypothetical protein
MRFVSSFVGVAFVITVVGCQTKTDDTSGTATASESANVAQVEPTSPVEDSGSDLAAMKDADTSEPADQEQRGRGTAGRGMRGMGRGPGGMRGMGGGPGAMSGMRADMMTLQAMFADRDKISRTITNRPDGAEAVTESDDEKIASMLQEHVPAMEDRILGNNPLPPMTFHPIFVELIKHSEDYTLTYEETEKGMKATYSSQDPYVVMLVQEHANLVSRFIRNGMEEVHQPYTLPSLDEDANKSSAADAPPSDETK